MTESLEALAHEIQARGGRLGVYYGLPAEMIRLILPAENIDAIFSNCDYTPFSKKRDLEISKIASAYGLKCFHTDDSPLHPPGTILKKNGEPYTVFTSFLKQAANIPVEHPSKVKVNNLGRLKTSLSLKAAVLRLLPERNDMVHTSGGRPEALKLLRDLRRSKPESSSQLSPDTCLAPHLKFGTCSAREVYEAARRQALDENPMGRKLAWRDFFYQIAWHYPHVFKTSFRSQYRELEWDYDKHRFKAWCEGRTGFPIVDAAMRELRSRGFISNRARLITASFLTKDLLIDWRWGEKHFAQYLTDYDPAINNGNWQWAASTGCDAQPYFRIFNPWLQQRKFDPYCVYIKRWLPELRESQARDIHGHEVRPLKDYPVPMVEHKKQARLAAEMYQRQ